MCRRAAIAAILGVGFLLAATDLAAAISAQERAALIAIYNALEGPNWKDKTNWLGAPGTECTWSGVTCDASRSTVIEISIQWNRARGVLPPEIGDLTNLEVFKGDGSTLRGQLPTEIGRLTKLRFLDLTGHYSDYGGGNDLSGPIPRELGQLISLRELYLGANAFTGPIPSELATLPNLEVFKVAYNRLDGAIPAGMFRIATLRRLDLTSNAFTGTLPETMDLPNLESFQFGGTALTGPIPAGIGKSVRLKQFVFPHSRLSGSIPAEISALSQLETFDGYANRLTGSLPDLSGLTNLKVLELGNNRLSGPLPPSIGQLQNLTAIYLSGNSLSGALPAGLFTLTKLETFGSAGSTFSGNLADFGRLTALRFLDLQRNDFRGPFPVELTRLEALEHLNLSGIPLGGSIPGAIRNLKKLKVLALQNSGLSDVPDEIGDLTALTGLHLDGNRISRSLASVFGKLTKLEQLSIGGNLFEGAVPAEVFSLSLLRYLDISDNDFTGALPPVSGMPRLQNFYVGGNRLTDLPPDLDVLKDLEDFYLGDNEFAGPLPLVIGQFTKLRRLSLERNRFSGAIPDWLGGLTSLTMLRLNENSLSGRVPRSITALSGIAAGQLTLDYNALYTDDPGVKAYLDARNPQWERRQTVAPADLRVTAQRKESLTVSWTPIALSSGPGGYRISYATSPQGPFQVVTTPNKTTSTFIVDSLAPATNYFFTIATVSYPSGSQKNVVVSDASPPLATATTAGAPAPASVVLFVHPAEIRQRPGASASASYVIGNVGDEPASITLKQEGDFFTHDESVFTLAGGTTRKIILIGKPQTTTGAFTGESIITGTGAPPGLSVRVSMLVTQPPTGSVIAQPSSNRIDVAAKITEGATGTVDFRNVGSATLQGIVISNVAWIIPPSGLIVIPPGETRTVTFRVDETKRPDASSPVGAVTGTLSLVYESGPIGKGGAVHSNHGVTTTTPVTVVYTVTPPVQSVTFPPFAAGEVALFVAGVGHVLGSSGLFISDFAIVNAFGVESPKDIRMYYSPSDPALPSKVTSVSQLEPNQGVTFGSVIKTVFENDRTIGTIQLRTRSLDQLFVNANIFNVTNRNGTYGTALPIFRSDRALRAGESLFLTGLRRDAARTTYTNLFIQETSGNTAQYEIEFFDAAGRMVGAKRTGSVSGFRLVTIFDTPSEPSVPVGAVAARITNAAGSGGRIVAFATPLDALSGDFWTVADWNRELGSAPDEPVIIPIAGSLRGSLNTFYRTDVAITNRAATSGSGTFHFYDASGSSRRREISLGAGESVAVDDFVGTSFPDLSNTFGYLQFDPREGAFGLTSRTFATTPALQGTFGTSVPTLPRSAALRLGQSKIIAGLDVASVQTILAAKPGTFRTNVGLVDISGKPATVEVTVIYTDIKQLVSGIRLTTVTYDLRGNQSIIDGIATRIQAANPNVSDLRSVQLRFRVTAGEGAVIVYTSSVDNGTADQVFRIE